MLKRILGLDLGIASVGWSLIDIDDGGFVNDKDRIFAKNGSIIDGGVRIFDPCETQQKESLATERRTARLIRRRLFRKSNRCKEIRELCEKEFKISINDDFFVNSLKNKNYEDVWILRKEAIERKLTSIELTRVLCHIVKHRGWKSNRKSEEIQKDSEANKMKNAINKLKNLIGENGTPGYYYGKQKLDSENFDNYKIKNKHGEYDHCIGRLENEKELKLIFEKQELNKEFRDKVLSIFSWEKGIKSMKNMVGNCLFEKGEKRAPKESYSAELFNVYTKINNLKVLDINDINYTNKFNGLVELFKNKKEVKYKDIRDNLQLNDNFKFKNLDYYQAEYVEFKKNKDTITLSKAYEDKIKKYEKEGFFIEKPDREKKIYFKNNKNEYKYKTIKEVEDEKIYSMVGYHKMKNINNFDIIESNPHLIDKITEALTYEKNDELSKKLMIEKGVPEKIIEDCLKLESKNFIHLSCKALQKIIPYLKNGLTYDKACKEAGYNFKNDDDNDDNLKNLLPTLEAYTKNEENEQLTNPVVKRTITQTRKVINAIIKKYGNFDQMNIEFTRELGKSFDDRNKIQKMQKEFRDIKDKAKTEIAKILDTKEENITDKQVLKLRLYNEQNGKSIYSFETLPDLKTILTVDKSCEIDHILPYSKSFDDSLNNKVLVLPKENQDKKNRTPYEYLNTSINWEEYKNKIWTINTLSYRKRKNLTTENPNYDDWKARNLCDTSYSAKYLKKYISKTLKFKQNEDIKNKIQVRPGTLTNYLRHNWGVGAKIRSDSDVHHMVDATIVACATQSMCQLISTLNARKHNQNIKSQQKEIYNEIEKLKQEKETKEILEKITELEKEAKWYNLIKEEDKLSEKCYSEPWNGFRGDLEKKVLFLTALNENGLPISNIISRMPRKKITGSAHDATIKSLDLENNKAYSKTKLEKLTLKNLETLVDKDGSSKNLYNILKQRLEECKDNAEQAFKDDIYMCDKNGEYEENKHPKIRSVKLENNYNNGGVLINNNTGVADNGSMPRIDIFLKNGKYYAVPFYVADFVKNKIQTFSKPHGIEFPIQEHETEKFYNEHFQFSLFKDQLIYFECKNKKYIGYFCSFDVNRQANSLKIESIDRPAKFTVSNKESKDVRIGLGTITTFKKFQIDALGYITEVKQEKRLGVIEKHKKEDKE